MRVLRGEIYYANLDGVVGSEQGGTRPVLIVQNNVGNKYSPTTIVAPITTRTKSKLPTHVLLGECGLKRPSMVLLEQVRTIDKQRLLQKVGDVVDMSNVNDGLKISMGVE